MFHPDKNRQRLYEYLEPFWIVVKKRNGEEEIIPCKPNRNDIESITDAIKGVTFEPVTAPAWIGPNAWAMPNPTELIVAKNGIFQLEKEQLKKVSDPTPLLFTLNALDYEMKQIVAPPLDGRVSWMTSSTVISSRLNYCRNGSGM